MRAPLLGQVVDRLDGLPMPAFVQLDAEEVALKRIGF
jgi:hypothetical protein